jgi:cell division protein FtsI (penicillin-binding protein 3)
VNDRLSRLKALMVFCLILAGIVTSRAVYIQIIGDPRLEKMAKRQFGSKVLISARRGVISDRNGEPLAVNTEISSLAANPNKIQNRKTVAKLLSKSLGLPYEKLLARLKEKKDFIWIKRRIPDAQIAQFKKWGIMDHSDELIPGLWLVKENYRKYPHQDLAAPVLGSTNIDSDGVEGVELWQNKRLQGKVIAMSSVQDALGRPTLYDSSAVKEAKDGETIQLTLDASLQFSVEEALKNSLEKTKAKDGAVIVMDAVSGDLLAVAHSRSELKRNRIVTDGYEPGSTMKPLLLASALSHGWKITDRLHGERGSFTVQGKRISEAETHEKFEWIDLKKMIEVSSNVVAAKLAMRLGSTQYISALRTFGLGNKTGLGFPGELAGWLPSTQKNWSPLTLANVGFGQGIMVTPLQMIRSYAALANGGYLVAPRLIKNEAKDQETPAPKRILSGEVANQVVSAMIAVTEKGSGVKAALEGYTVAGKTGTAQTVDPKTKKYSRNRYIATFIGFPVGVEPKIVVLTMLDEPKNIYYASETAAPLFREVLNAVVTRFGIPSTQPSTVKLAQSIKPKAGTDRIKTGQAHALSVAPEKLETLHPGADGKISWAMPNLQGLTLREALNTLKGNQFDLQVQGNGIIKKQWPEVGHKLGEGDRIELRLSDEL